VAFGKKHGRLLQYRWNPAAHGFVLADLIIRVVRDVGPNHDFVSGLDASEYQRVVAVIELDLPPNDPNARIIGGEYIDDPSIGVERLDSPPFVWIPKGPGPDQPEEGGNPHNPLVRPRVVQALMALGQQDAD
jgi:hypothetical protein